MNTDKLYFASLRVATDRQYRIDYIGITTIVTHKHLKYVLVKTSDMEKFEDLRTGQRYTTVFRNCNYAIDLGSIESFNETTGNTQRHITKRKALTLFDKRVDEWRSKKWKNYLN